MIAIISACGSNLASVQFAFARLGQASRITTDPAMIQSATHVVLPGVGTAHQAMSQLKTKGLIDVIRNLKQPTLGICLGMQILYRFSHEGEVPCLDIVPGNVMPLVIRENLTVPHMGWNKIRVVKQKSALVKNIPDQGYAYFVHSYVAPIDEYTLASTSHGDTFTAMMQFENFYGVQFHPERSSKLGATILRNFLSIGRE